MSNSPQVSRWLMQRMADQLGDLFEQELRTVVVIYLDEFDRPLHVADVGPVTPGQQWTHTIKPVHDRHSRLLVAVKIEYRDELDDCLVSQTIDGVSPGWTLNMTVPTKQSIHIG